VVGRTGLHKDKQSKRCRSKEPSIEELRNQYKNDISKSIRYISIDMNVAWIDAQILPRLKFEDH